MNFTENCIVLNATGVEWMDVKQHTIGDVTCCEDLMITVAICERRKRSFLKLCSHVTKFSPVINGLHSNQ